MHPDPRAASLLLPLPAGTSSQRYLSIPFPLSAADIRIGAIQSISYHWLPDILKQFSETYPNIRFELTIDGFSQLKEKIQSNKLDLLFVSRYSVPDHPFIPIGRDELMLVTPKDHPLAQKPSVSLSDINQENFILSSDGLDYETGKIFEMNNITPRIRYRLNEDFATLKMVEKGFGITFLPRLLLHNAPFDVCIRTFTEHYARVLGAAYSRDTTPSLAVMKFLDYVQQLPPDLLEADKNLFPLSSGQCTIQHISQEQDGQ